MSEDAPDQAPNCPNCGRPMTFAKRIWRGLGNNIDIFRCDQCRSTMSRPVSDTELRYPTFGRRPLSGGRSCDAIRETAEVRMGGTGRKWTPS
jgi:ribosomal protein L37AE/L43A